MHLSREFSRKSRQELHAELKRIASLQSEWNALSIPERARAGAHYIPHFPRTH